MLSQRDKCETTPLYLWGFNPLTFLIFSLLKLFYNLFGLLGRNCFRLTIFVNILYIILLRKVLFCRKEGNILEIFSQGEAFLDPDTGEKLGNEEELVGKVVVYNTQAKFSKAKVTEGKGSIEKGMVARVAAGTKDKQPQKEKKKLLW